MRFYSGSSRDLGFLVEPVSSRFILVGMERVLER